MEKFIRQLRIFEAFHICESSEGLVCLETTVTENSLNYYGNAHGGYLFTLCDQVAGLVSISLGLTSVTMQSNMNFIKAGQLGQTLRVSGTCIHKGRTSLVVEVDLKNEENLLARGTFTMYVTGQIEL